MAAPSTRTAAAAKSAALAAPGRSSRWGRVAATVKDLVAGDLRYPCISNVILISIALPLISIAFMIPALVTRSTLQQGMLFNVGYEVIRLLADWLSNLFSSFYYVQMASIPKFEGAGQLSAAGAFVLYGSLGAFVLGGLTGLVNIGVAEPLLQALAPPHADDDLLTSVALSATRIIGLFVPARIVITNMSGIMCGQSSSNFALVVPVYACSLGFSLIAAAVMIAIFDASGCKDMLRAANASAYEAALASANGSSLADSPLPFSPEDWVCPAAETALIDASWVESLNAWLGVVLLLGIMLIVSTRRGYFTEHGCNLRAYANAALTKVDGEDDDDDGVDDGGGRGGLARMCTTAFVAVNVRSLLNNSRELVTPLAATKIGIAEAAAVNFFEALSYISYGVPNVCALGVMAIGARLLGARRKRDFRRLVHVHVGFAVTSAAAALMIASLSFESNLEKDFINEVDYATFKPLANELWPIAAAMQPLRALVGVYGPILMACQGFVEWGVTVTLLTFLVYVPLTVAGSVAGDVKVLVGANLAYNLAHFLALAYLVHWRLLPKLTKEGSDKVAPADASADASSGGAADKAFGRGKVAPCTASR